MNYKPLGRLPIPGYACFHSVTTALGRSRSPTPDFPLSHWRLLPFDSLKSTLPLLFLYPCSFCPCLTVADETGYLALTQECTGDGDSGLLWTFPSKVMTLPGSNFLKPLGFCPRRYRSLKQPHVELTLLQLCWDKPAMPISLWWRFNHHTV